MAWKKLLTEDDFGGFANPSAVIGGAATNGAATTAMRSDAAPALGPLTRDLDFGAFKGVNVANPTGAQHVATKAYVDSVAQGLAPKDSVRLATAASSDHAWEPEPGEESASPALHDDDRRRAAAADDPQGVV